MLMKNEVKFICCDMPEATELTIHIFGALAQWEKKADIEPKKHFKLKCVQAGRQDAQGRII